jgi:N-carbamoylputrescine amidase
MRISNWSSKIFARRVRYCCSEVAARPAANLKKTLALAERAAKQGANIICTQELFRSQYFCQNEDHENFKLAEPIGGPSTKAFQKLA